MQNFLSFLNNLSDKTFGMRFQPSSEARLSKVRMRLIREFNCGTVIDVGANRGDWAKRVRQEGYRGEIVSYEPSNVYQYLEQRAKNDSSWKTRNVALSDALGFATFYTASNDNLSSSLLEPKEILHEHSHIQFSPGAQVCTTRLDNETFHGSDLYLKIDVQGAEQKVLSGAENLFSQLAVIEFESSIIQLYRDETNHYELANFLLEKGFQPQQVVVTHWDENLSTVSLDSIFYNSRIRDRL